MNLYRIVIFIFLAVTVILSFESTPIAETGEKLRVGISPFTPFVILSEDKPRGFSIDLWREIAKKLDVKYEFIKSKSVARKLKDLLQRRTDIAIGGMSITEDRERKFDFCYPFFHTGLDILVPYEDKPSLFSFLASLITKTKLTILGAFFLVLIIVGHLIWLAERSREQSERCFHNKYFPGVFEGMYWAIVTASTVGYGDRVPRKWIGRILAGILIIISLPLLAFFVAQLSSDITLQSLRTNIQGPEDLWGRRVGVVTGTTSEDYITNFRARTTKFNKIEDAYQSLVNSLLDAVVYDAPNLLYYAQGEGKGIVTVVGKTFAPQDYGMVVPQGSFLRERVNLVLLEMMEKGDMERIHSKWFGD